MSPTSETNPSSILASLKKYEEVVAACNRCGFCTSYCPTYNATGNEIHSPRGRNQLVRALIEKKGLAPQSALESIDSCLLCGECTSVCFSEVPTAELMVQARHFLNQSLGLSPALEFFFKKILPHPARFKWFLKTLFLVKRSKITNVLQKSSWFKRFFPKMAAADALMPTVPLKFLLEDKSTYFFQEKNWAHSKPTQPASPGAPSESRPAPTQRPKIAYMPTCGSQYVLPEVGLATLKLFKKLHLDFVIPDLICCGLPAASTGALDSVRQMALENIRRFEAGHFDSILSDDSSCTAHLKDYPRYFAGDQRGSKRAHDLSQKIKDLPTILLQKGLKDHLKLVSWMGGSVAYHDPCKAQYAQKIIHPPRELLASIPRLSLVPIADADQCCGGGGTYSFTHAEMSQSVGSTKIKNIIASGCRIVVTSSASCLIQLRAGLREKKSNIEAMHLSTFLVRALEKKK